MLYCFISHGGTVHKDRENITTLMLGLNYDKYLIFYGGENLNIQDEKIIHLECNDNYEGLPNKIHNLCKYLVNNKLSEQYSHFCKVDCTTKLKKLLPLLNSDYYGYLCTETDPPEYRRKYHQNRCSANSIWNNKKYDGQFVVYCAGGFCYVLSKNSIRCISNNPDDHNQDIYEDLYIAQQLIKCNIYPQHLNTTPFFSSW